MSNDDDDDTNNKSGNIVAQDAHAYAARHTLILIDTHPSMFEPCIRICNGDSVEDSDGDSDDDDTSSTTEERNEYDTKKKAKNSSSSTSKALLTTPFDASLMAVERLLHHKVRTVAMSKLGKRDGVGVILYGTPDDIKKNHDEKEGDDDENDEDNEDDNQVEEETNANESLKELIKLTPPGVDQIKTIRSCLPPEFYHSNNSDHVGSYHHQGNNKYKNDSTKSPTNALIRDMDYKRAGSQTRCNGRERDLFVELFGKGDSDEDSEGESESEVEDDEEQEKKDCSLRHALNEATRTFANAK